MITSVERCLERNRAIAERIARERPDSRNQYVLVKIDGQSYAILGSYSDRSLLARYALGVDEFFLWIGPDQQASCFVE